ncbi:MAG: Gfo/Idh/MocA family oxidoreductase, partial [Geminicoccaceae bacterium]
RYGVDATFSDYEELLAELELDGIGIAVGPGQHPRIAIAALERGLPVFMEKPPALDQAGAEGIAAAAKAADKLVCLGFMKRFSTGNKIAKNLLNAATFGPRLGITASYMTAPTYFEGDPDYRGFFLHHCIHYLDLLPWLMGAPITDISAREIEHAPGKLLIHLSLAFGSGAIGTLVMGTVQSRGGPVETIQIMGDHQRIEISNVTDVNYVRDPAFKAEDAGATLDDAADSLCWTPNFTVAANEDHKGYRALLQASLDAMRGRPSEAPTIDDGVRAMATLATMTAALGRTVRAS